MGSKYEYINRDRYDEVGEQDWEAGETSISHISKK
jgi:hypothetical protein